MTAKRSSHPGKNNDVIVSEKLPNRSQRKTPSSSSETVPSPVRNRARRKIPGRNPFLDIEADVDGNDVSGEEAENDDDDAGPEATDDMMIEDTPLFTRLHLEREMNQDNSIIDQIASRYLTQQSSIPVPTHYRQSENNHAAGNAGPSHSNQDKNFLAAEVPQFERMTADLPPRMRERLKAHVLISIPPCEDDWETWEVPVDIGKEEVTVHDILLVAEYGGVHRRSTPPRSAFTSPGLSGHIYIEAQTRFDVVTLCKPLRGVHWWNVKFVTREDAMKLLNRRPASYMPRTNTWIRLAQWPYQNDLAFVKEVLNNEALRVMVVPRVRYYKTGYVIQSWKRPKACLFSREEAIKISGPLSLRTEGSGSSARNFYFDIRYEFTIPFDSYTTYDSSGFLELVVDSSGYLHIDIYPQLADLAYFMNCVSIPHTFKLLTLRLTENRKLRGGDRVLITPKNLNFNADGYRHIGRVCIVDDITNTCAYIHFLSSNSGAPETLQVPLSSIRRHFRIGDYVRVKAGHLKGRVGWVTNINDAEEQMTVLESAVPTNQMDVMISLVEFIEVECRQGENPNREVFDMGKSPLSVYENVPVTLLEGPLKGRSGLVRSISIRRIAQVELRGSHALRNQLQDLDVRHLAFELDYRKWFRLQVADLDENQIDVKLEAIHTIPAACSLLSAYSEVRRSTTPLPKSNFLMDNYSSVDSPTPISSGGIIPDTCWLMKLPHRDTFRTLQLSIQSFGTYENGKWDGLIGFYKGINEDRVKFFSKESGHLLIPFYYLNHVPPTKCPQNAHCLAEGKDLGGRFKILTFGEYDCEVVPFRGVKADKTRRIATKDLATIG
ncbi:hypothetical protein NP233_g11449 [Leucocoprinus birnbaumii]|uniref:Chromatin elongation factor SPT5 n=1 Tax=Leucocoprinus birnbaumii TaxID=56174 RepID=A0AAD5VIG7_9AGAR|nr:hypothetical protein NP233_g11449 [Leucocoprinus birnbaumii]